MALLEGAPVGRATACGMAAVTASLMCCLSAGDHVVASRALFGAIRYVLEEVLTRFGITSPSSTGRDLAPGGRHAARRRSSSSWRRPSNPTLEIVDIKAVCEIAHQGTARG